MGCLLLLFGCQSEILIAQQTVRRFVFFDLREAADRRVEAVVGVVVAALADLAKQDGAGARLDREVVVHSLRDPEAFARTQTDLRARGNRALQAVAVDGHVGLIINFFIRQAVVHADEAVTAAAVDNVLGLVPVEMVRGHLALLQIQQLLCVDLRIFFRLRAAAVADGDEGEAEFVKIAEAEIRDIPVEHTVAHFIVFMALRLPLPGREVTEWRQIALVFFAHGLQLPERFVDLRTFHNTSATG